MLRSLAAVSNAELSGVVPSPSGNSDWEETVVKSVKRVLKQSEMHSPAAAFPPVKQYALFSNNKNNGKKQRTEENRKPENR